MLLAPLALGLWVISPSLYLAGTWPGVYVPVHGCFWKNFSHVDVHVQLWLAFGRISSIFFLKGSPDPAVDSRPTCCSRRLHLDSGLFLRACIWQALGPVFTCQSTVAFGRISVMWMFMFSSGWLLDEFPVFSS